MKIWHYGKAVTLSGYSIVKGLLYDVIAMTPNSELSPFERLYIALASGHECHSGYLTDTYMACGCFEKARDDYRLTKHHRKLGDVAWILGDFHSAEEHYKDVSHGAQSYRTRPDYDKLIRLAFIQEDWEAVIQRFMAARFSKGFGDGQVICGRSSSSGRSYLEMLAVSHVALGAEISEDIRKCLDNAFGVSQCEWDVFFANGAFSEQKTIEKIKRRCPPSFGKRKPITVECAYAKGITPKACRVLDYIKHADKIVDEAQGHLVEFGRYGKESDLRHFIELVTGSEIRSVSHSVLFSAMGHDSFEPESLKVERMMRLYCAHPIMDKRHFGNMLKLKFENGYPLSGRDIITGLFQRMASFQYLLSPSSTDDAFNFKKLAQFRDWAELRLKDWIESDGSSPLRSVSDAWNNGAAKDTLSIREATNPSRLQCPRDMSEWGKLLEQAAQWLDRVWNKEIGTSQWVSENQLFHLLKEYLKPIKIEQHARPVWLEPQHLDVFIPDASTAVEFMGEQHYRPIDFFGGHSAFSELQERDQRKQEICKTNGVALHYVRFDEDIGLRAKEIAECMKEELGQ